MQNFTYYTPTRVVFGKDTENEVGVLCKSAGATKVLLHYGSASAKASGLVDRVAQSLQAAGIAVVELGGVVPNPHLALVRQGIDLCRAEEVDFLLAVGGGSVIDSAKAIAYGVPYEGDVWDFYAGKATIEAALPVGCVCTIAAAGSEMSDSSVITNTETGEKRGSNSDWGRPRFAVLNPELTYTLPPYQTACGAADILMHTLERYFTADEPMELTRDMAEALLRTVMNNARTVMRRPKSYEARAELMWAGSLSHNGLMACGGGRGDWACHQLAHEISGRYNTAHGAALTSIWGSWARYVMAEDTSRFVRLALEVLEVPDEGSDEQIALAGIEEMENFFWSLELPTTLQDLEQNIDEAAIHEMAVGCSRGGARTIGDFKVLAEKDMENILKIANK